MGFYLLSSGRGCGLRCGNVDNRYYDSDVNEMDIADELLDGVQGCYWLKVDRCTNKARRSGQGKSVLFLLAGTKSKGIDAETVRG
jgi:hypothetical protein